MHNNLKTKVQYDSSDSPRDSFSSPPTPLFKLLAYHLELVPLSIPYEMEGMMLCCARPRPPWVGPPAPLPVLRREASPVLLVTGEGRRDRHSSSCRRGREAVPSIWHAITPSSGGGAVAHRALPPRRGSGGEEGSWNAAWDARPARWLHGSDSVWLLFGVCSCFSPPVWVGEEQKEAEEVAGARDFGMAEATPVEHYKVTGMSADGRCLFRAVAYGACLSTRKEAPNEVQQKELADDLRARVVDELLKRRDEIEQFVEEDFDTYLERMRQPYVWGGEPELLMASHVLQKPLSVFMRDRSSGRLVNIAKYGQKYGKDQDNPINVLFHGYGHYDALETSD